jgi:hypothetical protein
MTYEVTVLVQTEAQSQRDAEYLIDCALSSAQALQHRDDLNTIQSWLYPEESEEPA